MAEYKVGDIYDLPDGKSVVYTESGFQPYTEDVPTTPLIRLGRGAMDIVQGIKQGLLWATDPEKFKEYTAQVDKELGLYEKGRKAEGDTGVDWWRIAGQAGATAPISLASAAPTLGLQALKSAAQGGLAAGTAYTEGGKLQDKLLQIGAGTTGGALSPYFVKGLTTAVQKGLSGVNALKNAGISVLPGIEGKAQIALADYGIDLTKVPATMRKNLITAAREQLKVSGGLDAAALARKANAEALGFVGETGPTAAQLTRNPKMWAMERNLEKLDDVGQPLTERYMKQSEKFRELGAELTQKMGGKSADIADVNDSITNAITNKWRDTQSQVGKIYDRITQKYGDKATSDLKGVANYLDSIDWDETAAPVVNSVRNLLLKRGVLAKVTDDAGNTFIQPTGKTLTAKEIESIRKTIGGRFSKSKDPHIAGLSREVIDAIDDDVIDATGDDVFKVARDTARTRFNDFSSKVGTTMKKITGETMSSDDAFRAVKKAPSEELQAIKDNLTGVNIPDKSGQGMEAWNNVRSQVMRDLFDESTKTGGFSGSTFTKELNRIGRKKLVILFGENETKRLFDIAKVGGEMTKAPALAAVNYSGTAPTIANYIKKAVGVDIGDIAGKGKNILDVQYSLSGMPTTKPLPVELPAKAAGLLGELTKRGGAPAGIGMSGGLLELMKQNALNQ